MADRGRYDSAMFWIAFGTAAALVFSWSGLCCCSGRYGCFWCTAAPRRRPRRQAARSRARRRSQTTRRQAVRGYSREREKLIDMWEAHERNRDPKK